MTRLFLLFQGCPCPMRGGTPLFLCPLRAEGGSYDHRLPPAEHTPVLLAVPALPEGIQPQLLAEVPGLPVGGEGKADDRRESAAYGDHQVASA